MPTLKDRLLTRQGAYAITSPGAILAGGAAAAVGIAAGIALPVAAVAGAAAYAGVAVARLPRGPQRPAIRPDTLRPPWRGFVEEAIDARDRFDRAVANARTGPLRTRLQAIADRVAEGVEESWRVAAPRAGPRGRAGPARAARDGRGPAGRGRGRAAAAGGPTIRAWSPPPTSLRSQIDSTRRIGEVARDTRDRLRLLDARLDESVARAVELSLRAGDATDASGLGSDVEAIVGEMESLRLALEETRSV